MILDSLAAFIWGWPLVSLVIIANLIATVLLRGIQFRYFFPSWKYLRFRTNTSSAHYISPLQAFLNTLSASLGNGSAAGMATALYSGGPGVVFWIFINGFLGMALRFAEVFLSTTIVDSQGSGMFRGGPMVFLHHVPGRALLPILYAIATLFVSIAAGSGMQANSITISVIRLTGVDALVCAGIALVLVAYILGGGAQRIMRFSETIIPIKVFVFFIATTIVFVLHLPKLFQAIHLVFEHAFTSNALIGVANGYTVQQALRFGISRSVSATEAGLGTAGIFFGSTKNPDPWKSSCMSMISLFISNHLVCCVLLLLLIMTGVWDSGLTSTAMTCAAYETVFGSFGGVLITFLSMVFGLGVLVAYAYIGRECWLFLFGPRYIWIYNTAYCMMAALGALTPVNTIWAAVDIGNACMMILNVYGIMMLFPAAIKKITISEQKISPQHS
jgi:AGCS family alanine or glycine:cation symporter